MTAEEIRAAYSRFYIDIAEQTQDKMLTSDAIATFTVAVMTEIAAQLAELNAALKPLFIPPMVVMPDGKGDLNDE